MKCSRRPERLRAIRPQGPAVMSLSSSRLRWQDAATLDKSDGVATLAFVRSLFRGRTPPTIPPYFLNRVRTFLLLWSLFVGVICLAQDSGTITGVVVSTWDGTPLPSVAVTVRGTTLATQTDANGRYELKNVPTGDQVLR